MKFALPARFLAAIGFAVPATAQCRNAIPRYPSVHVHLPFPLPAFHGHRDHCDPPRRYLPRCDEPRRHHNHGRRRLR
jgi:hypothetical protein